MPQSGDPVSNAKAALAGANKAFPSSMAPKAPAAPAAPAAKTRPSIGEPEAGIKNELAAKSANVNQYVAALPKMHKGGRVPEDGAYQLKMDEHVLTPKEADLARKHALIASGMKSLATSKGKAVKTAKPGEAKEKTSMNVEGANVVDRTKAPGDIPPAPRSPLKQDDAYQKQRVSTI